MENHSDQESLIKEALRRIEDQLKDLQNKLGNSVNANRSGPGQNNLSNVMAKPFSDMHSSTRAQGQCLLWVAAFCLAIALIFILLIIGDYNLFTSESVSSNVGKIIFILLTVAFCIFCLKQYDKQSCIAQDYSYKAALLDSLRPISEELEAIDVKVRNEYIDSISTEICKNPLRNIKHK